MVVGRGAYNVIPLVLHKFFTFRIHGMSLLCRVPLPTIFVYFGDILETSFSILDILIGIRIESNRVNIFVISCVPYVEPFLIALFAVHTGVGGRNLWMFTSSRSIMAKLTINLVDACMCYMWKFNGLFRSIIAWRPRLIALLTVVKLPRTIRAKGPHQLLIYW